MSSLLDDALAATARSSASAVDPAPAPTTAANSLEAHADLTGAQVTYTRRIAPAWSTSLWADATWSGSRAAGISLKGTW